MNIRHTTFSIALALLALSVPLTVPGIAQADIFHSGTGSIDGYLCVGVACDDYSINGGRTLVLSEDSVRLTFEDASDIAGFPTNDFEIKINDDFNAGDNYFSVRDVDSNRTIFRLDAGARESALNVDSAGRIGLGTQFPLEDLHIVAGDTPTIQLDQSSGVFGNQKFDIGVNEINFFIRETGSVLGTTLPFRLLDDVPNGMLGITPDGVGIFTNDSSGEIDIRARLDVNGDALIRTDLEVSGRLGVGTDTPEQIIHIRSNANDTDAFALFDANGAGSDAAFLLRQNGVLPTTWEFRNQQDSGRLNVGIAGGNTPFKIDNAANNNLLRLGRNGQPGEVNITGTLVVNNTALNVPDYVFADDYALRPLADVQAFIDENSHLPDVPSEAEIKANGVDMTAMQMTLLKKVEELTLYTLEQDKVIQAQAAREILRDRQIEGLMARLAAVELK